MVSARNTCFKTGFYFSCHSFLSIYLSNNKQLQKLRGNHKDESEVYLIIFISLFLESASFSLPPYFVYYSQRFWVVTLSMVSNSFSLTIIRVLLFFAVINVVLMLQKHKRLMIKTLTLTLKNPRWELPTMNLSMSPTLTPSFILWWSYRSFS